MSKHSLGKSMGTILEAKRWSAPGLSADEAAEWRVKRCDLTVALAWRAHRLGPDSCYLAKEGVSAQTIADWSAAGVDVDSHSKEGLTALRGYLAKGYSLNKAAMLVRTGLSPDDAKRVSCREFIVVYRSLFLEHPELSSKRVLCLPLATTVLATSRGASSLREAYATQREAMVLPGIGVVAPPNASAQRAVTRLPVVRAGTSVSVLGLYYGDKRTYSIPPDFYSADLLGRDKLQELALVQLPTGKKLYLSWMVLAKIREAFGR